MLETFNVLRIDEPDFGCEGRPDGMAVKDNVLLKSNYTGEEMTVREKDARLYELVQDFEYRDRIELMAIDSEGTVFLTSSGFLPQDTAMPDLADSRTNGGIGSFTGRWDGQKIMAVTVLSSLSGEDLLGLRYVVSMQAIDRQLTLITVFASLVALAILLFVLYTSSYFMNSIIAPVGEVSRTARQIAQGDFDVRLDTHNDDEIGQLCDTINDMAVELGASRLLAPYFSSS